MCCKPGGCLAASLLKASAWFRLRRPLPSPLLHHTHSQHSPPYSKPSRCLRLQSVRDREVCVYSISCKRQHNIDITLEWLTAHAKQ